MRKLLLTTLALAGVAVGAQFAGASPVQAQPAVSEAGLVHTVQYNRHYRHREYRHYRHHYENRHYRRGYRHY